MILSTVEDIDKNIPYTRIKKTNSIAIIIGNQKYLDNQIPDVDYAINDAETVKKYLIRTLGYREQNIILETNASKGNLETIFGSSINYEGKLYNNLKMGKSDIFIYYSGHGMPDTNSREAYLVPSDATSESISLSGYPLNQMYENIGKIAKEKKSPNVFIVLDACFSGKTEKGSLIKNASPVMLEINTPAAKFKNGFVMTSASGKEISSWYPEKEHSMFTYFFLKGIKSLAEKKKANITANDVYQYITDETEGLPYYAKRLYGRTQTPQLIGDGSRAFVKID